jgi:hypothetical protein
MVAVERTANIKTIRLKRKKLFMHDGVKIARDTIARSACVI